MIGVTVLYQKSCMAELSIGKCFETRIKDEFSQPARREAAGFGKLYDEHHSGNEQPVVGVVESQRGKRTWCGQRDCTVHWMES